MLNSNDVSLEEFVNIFSVVGISSEESKTSFTPGLRC